METTENIKEVQNYYDHSQRWFSLLYSDKQSLGIHYGLCNGNCTKAEASINTYRKLVEVLGLKKGDKILDAGCGVGGAVLWLARNIGVTGTGIMISEVQLKKANKFLQKSGLNGINFSKQNFFQTSFENESFDHIFGIESLCYAYPVQENAYRELFRVLKPGGRIAIIDGVVKRRPDTQYESKNLDAFIEGYAVQTMCTPEEIIDSLRKAGFKNIKAEDHTSYIAKSVKEINRKGYMLLPMYLLYLTGLVTYDAARNFKAVLSQKYLYDAGIFGYYVFVAEK